MGAKSLELGSDGDNQANNQINNFGDAKGNIVEFLDNNKAVHGTKNGPGIHTQYTISYVGAAEQRCAMNSCGFNCEVKGHYSGGARVLEIKQLSQICLLIDN